jgi:hypothetical protein
MIMATTSAIAAASLFVTLFFIIRKQLASPKTKKTETEHSAPQKAETSQPKQEA